MCYYLHWETEALGHLWGFWRPYCSRVEVPGFERGGSASLVHRPSEDFLPPDAFARCFSLWLTSGCREPGRVGGGVQRGRGWSRGRERPGSCYSHHTLDGRPPAPPSRGFSHLSHGGCLPSTPGPSRSVCVGTRSPPWRPVVAEWLPSTFRRRLGATG